MPSNELDIKVRLAGARAAQRDADQTGRAVRGIGRAEKEVADRGRLAELSMRGVERTSHRLRGTTKLLLGATGIGGLAFGLKEVVHATINAQTAQAKLQRGMRNAGLSWQIYGAHVTEALEKQAEFAGFAKGDVTDSFTNFVRTTGNVNKALQLNAIAANVAHTKGMGLAGAQTLVARAMLGSFRSLKNLGIEAPVVTTQYDLLRATTKHATIEQVRHAKALDQQAMRTKAVALIQQKFAGQTAAWGKTAEGSVARARVSLEIAQEQIGAILLPYVAKAAQKVAGFAQSFTKNWPEIKTKIKSAVDGVRSTLGPLLSFMAGHKKGLLEFAGAFVAIAGGLKAIKAVGRVTGVSGLAGTLGKATGLKRFAERGASPANPLWVAIVGKGTGTEGFLPKLLKRGGPAALASGGSVALVAGAAVAPLGIAAAIAARNRRRGGATPLGDRNTAAANANRYFGPTADQPVFDAQGFPTGAVIHTHVHIDGREVGNSLTRLAKHHLGLR